MAQEDKKIIVNQIKTPDKTILCSKYRHDYVTYTDKSRLTFSVDGGTSYLRRGVGFSPVYTLMSEKEEVYIKNKGITYSPVTGRFIDNNGKFRDTTIDSKGYRRVRIAGIEYKAHRLIFILSEKDLTDKQIDHKDNIRSNNIWTNLRIVTQEQNQANALIRKDNSTKIKGLTFNKKENLWIGRVQKNKKRYKVSSTVKEKTIEKLSNLRYKLHGVFSNNGYENKSLDTFYEEISLYDDSPFEDIRENLYRGGRGKYGTEELTWVKLSEMNTKWLMNTITYYLKNVQEIKVEDTNKLIESLEVSDTALISHLIKIFDRECNTPEFKEHDKEPGKTLVEKNRHIEYYIQELKYRQDNNIFIKE